LATAVQSHATSLGYHLITEEASADVRILPQMGTPIGQWVYVAVAPFPTVRDDVSSAELAQNWQGQSSTLGDLYLDEATEAQLLPLLAAPASSQPITTTAWPERPSWRILPWQQTNPAWKVWSVDGQSPLEMAFAPDDYPLTVWYGVQGAETAVAQFLAGWTPIRNYQPDQITRILLTGPSGLGRAVASRIEAHGIEYVAQSIRPLFQQAHITHFSNEMPFSPDCPPEELEAIGDTRFCAPDHYLELLTAVGTTINEMTGNHVNDWGVGNMVHTLELYEQAGIATFGGGRTLAEAQAPLLISHHGNPIAFVGCNHWGPYGAWATETRPGAAPCGDYSFIRAQIAQLAADGYVVIATIQYPEYYRYDAPLQQQADFRALAEAGAAVVSGSQGHHVQAFDFVNAGFIHYGLGNFVFDQMEMLGTRQSVANELVVQNGRLLSIELHTSLIEDYCCPRPMTTNERVALLTELFASSGWPVP
jgi:poly-gamma-glutamate synthesis protein (capsule biosynthesis protein)